MIACAGPRRYFPDEEPDVERIRTGWELTDERHGYCGFCGNEGHIRTVCPHRPHRPEPKGSPRVH